MPKTGNRTSQQGGQLNNDNAVKHGAFRSDAVLVHDRRTKDARFVETVELSLVCAIGGDPSPQQSLLCRRAAFKALRCALAEAEMIKNNSYWSSKDSSGSKRVGASAASQRLKDDYLKWSASLREDLKLLGLERRAKDVQSVQQYVHETYGTEVEQ